MPTTTRPKQPTAPAEEVATGAARMGAGVGAGEAGVAAGAAEGQTVPKPVVSGQGAQPWVVKSKLHRNQCPPNSETRQSNSNLELSENEERMEFQFTFKSTNEESGAGAGGGAEAAAVAAGAAEGQFTLKSTYEESLDEKSGIFQCTFIMGYHKSLFPNCISCVIYMNDKHCSLSSKSHIFSCGFKEFVI